MGRWGAGKVEQDAGPLMVPAGTAAESAPSVLGGLMLCGQVHSSSSSEDCGGGGGGACAEGGGGGSKRSGKGISLGWRMAALSSPPPPPPWWGDDAPLC